MFNPFVGKRLSFLVCKNRFFSGSGVNQVQNALSRKSEIRNECSRCC